MHPIIEIMNEEYRREIDMIAQKKAQLSETEDKIKDKKEITQHYYEKLKDHIEFLNEDIKLREAYASGVFQSREKIMSYVFNN